MICWGLTDQPALIRGLLQPEAYGHPVQEITLLETHISWVILTGPYAYKLKKPVNLGFLDFTSLEQRQHFCLEELRLNRRFGSDLYQAVLPVVGSLQAPRVGGDGPPLEFALQMRQFDQADLLPAVLARGAIGAEAIGSFADRLARVHAEAAVAGSNSGFGTPDAVREPVLANFHTLLERRPTALSGDLQAALLALRGWSEREFGCREPLFRQRLAAGRVRECHGDLHLGNLVWRHARIEAFDCLEFAPALRWIDVISDLAFLAMDLEKRGQGALAAVLLNRWLEHSGDYAGLALWRWYGVYRALVRAKVAALGADLQGVRTYVQRADWIRRRRPRMLLLCHGLSGSGKSHHSAQLLGPLCAIRLRSDVERKRLFGLWGEDAEPCGTGKRTGDPYAPGVSEELFAERLPQAAAAVLEAGFTAIVDATFLRRLDRQRMGAVAAAAGVPLLILDLQAPSGLLRQRISRRQRLGQDPSDADLAVLDQQLRSRESLSAAELRLAVAVGPDQDPQTTLGALERRLRAWTEPAVDLDPVDSALTPDPPHPPGCAAPPAGSGSAGGC